MAVVCLMGVDCLSRVAVGMEGFGYATRESWHSETGRHVSSNGAGSLSLASGHEERGAVVCLMGVDCLTRVAVGMVGLHCATRKRRHSEMG